MKQAFSIILLVLIATTANAQADTVFNQTDDHGLKQGYWKKSYSNGNLRYKGFFKDDSPQGELRRYYESGAIQAILIFGEDGEHTKARMFYEDGEVSAEGYFIGQTKDSTWKYYSFWTGTLVSQEKYSLGKKNGVQISFYNNGKISEEIEYKNDVKDGIWNQYFEDGKKKLTASYVNGKVNGRYTFYYPNGAIYMLGTFVENKKNGLWIFYDDERQEKYRLTYNHGELGEEDQKMMVEKDREFFNTVDENIGKFEDPSIEDFYGKKPY